VNAFGSAATGLLQATDAQSPIGEHIYPAEIERVLLANVLLANLGLTEAAGIRKLDERGARAQQHRMEQWLKA